MTLSSPSPVPIRILADDLINKIAAGEVVERPLNVVKELVENAIDASATDIAIDIDEGGHKGVVVVDNGGGMSPEDMKLALLRHATSKIACLDDLFAIRTLGFRGEALPAIASVSRMTIISRPYAAEAAYRLQLDGGTVIEESPGSHAPGTRLEVRDLFFNTPARLKFLKSTSTEWSHIVDYVERAALSHPAIAFSLGHNGKAVLDIRDRTHTAHRLAQIFDTAFAKQGVFFEDDRLRGWLGFPELNRKNPSGLYFFVNGRPIRDKVIQHALMEAYQGLVMKGRYPVAILHLEISPAEVDVNVHPTKSEVRFQNGQSIHQWVWKTVRRILQTQPWIQNTEKTTVAPFMAPKFQGTINRAPTDFIIPQSTAPFNWNLELPLQPTATATPSRIAYTELGLIGQLQGTYLLCEHVDRLVLIDQHAAHERIGFEALKKAYRDARLRPEPLLIPFQFDLSAADAAILLPQLARLESIGIDISQLGKQSFALQAVPTLLNDVNWANWTALLPDLIDELRDFGTTTVLDEHIDDLLATIACHRQIRANQRLNKEEMLALLAQLGDIDFAYHCPHGRPAAVEIPLLDIEKWFKRRV